VANKVSCFDRNMLICWEHIPDVQKMDEKFVNVEFSYVPRSDNCVVLAVKRPPGPRLLMASSTEQKSQNHVRQLP
jgi:hypothetical protein